MDYRKDIDGLRSIAVSLVVLHHAGFGFLPGGYVGVDVFFVISGFLITGIIYQKVQRGEFSFSEFYIRRIRRLMPALFAMIFVTSVFAFILLFPSDLERYGWSLLWVSAYLGNFFFWREYGGYFAENTQEAPLLHTWSLAVEEQYYLIWPFYIILGIRFLGFKAFGALSIAGFLFAIFFSEWATQNTIGAAYYLLPTRFFELLMGSLLAIFWKQIPTIRSVITNDVLSIAGLLAICASAVFLTPTSSFPGYNALYPVVGSALLIFSGRSSPGIVNRMLSFQPFVFIGLISYSLYLWHWPIFAYLTYAAIELNLLIQLLAVGLSVLFAYLSWRYVETPFRKQQGHSLAHVSFNLLAKPMLAIIALVAVIISFDGLKPRFDSDLLLMDEALNSRPHALRTACHSPSRRFDVPPTDECIFGAVENGEAIDGFLFGDSHANHVVGFLEVIAEDSGHVVQDYSMDQCPPIFDFSWGRTSQVANACYERNALAKQYIESNQFEFVVLSASWPNLDSQRVFKDGERVLSREERAAIIEDRLRTTLASIIDSGAIPILMDDVPSIIDGDPRCPIKQLAFDSELLCETVRIDNVEMESLFDQFENEFPSIVRVSPGDLFCSELDCELSVRGIPVFHDADHLNMVASRELGNLYLETHQNPISIAYEKLRAAN